LATVASIVLITPLGFLTKFYGGVGAGWVNNRLGGVLYEVFWCLVVFALATAARPSMVAVSVLLATSALEVLQLGHPPALEWLRGNFVGRTVLGTSFDPWDFPHYVSGCGIGWAWMRWLIKPSPEVKRCTSA
jgi:hypothetical protein